MYRKDFRSLKQFKEDIKNGTIHQARILNAFLERVYTNKQYPKIWNRGTDNSGKYVKLQDVTSYPDYEIEGFGLLEIQYSSTFCNKFFHIKIKKILLSLSLNSKILMVNGWNSHPVFILIDKKIAKVIQARCRLVKWRGGGLKKAYRIPTKWFNWQELEK